MAVLITAKMDPRLKAVIGTKADEAGLTLSEFVVRALATYVERPELSVVPRKRMGRPRKPILLPA